MSYRQKVSMENKKGISLKSLTYDRPKVDNRMPEVKQLLHTYQ